MISRSLFFVFCATAVLAIGCDGGNKTAAAKLSGKVTYKDQPVTAGKITIYGESGGTYLINIKPDGSFEQSDLPTGNCAVTIETESANPKGKKTLGDYGGNKGKQGGAPKEKAASGGMPPGAGGASPKPEGSGGVAEGGAYVEIPKKYADKAKSGLTITLAKGTQTHDFKLTD